MVSVNPSVSAKASLPGLVIRIRAKYLVTSSYTLNLLVLGPSVNNNMPCLFPLLPLYQVATCWHISDLQGQMQLHILPTQ